MYYSREQVTAMLLSFHKQVKDFVVPVNKSSANAWISNQDHLFRQDKDWQIANLGPKLKRANDATNTFNSMAIYLSKNSVSVADAAQDNQKDRLQQLVETVYNARDIKDEHWRHIAVLAYELGMRVEVPK